MFEYQCTVRRVIDGDTVDVDVDLGFGVVLSNERVRIVGIDTPETRTRDKIEKVFGLAATKRVSELLSGANVVLLSKEFKGKFGRILGDFRVDSGVLSEILLNEHHAVPYSGNKASRQPQHLINRELLMNSGLIDRNLIESIT